nr:metalloregulator ArsR/SmtB family transcription factor [Nocardioides sp. LMS-CY]
MSMIQVAPADAVQAHAAVESAGASALFRALGDPSRLSILRHLELGPHRVADLVEHLGLAQSTVSKHLACLRDCGLVSSTPQGRASMFALVPGVPVDRLLSAAESVLVATGAAADSCASVSPSGSGSVSGTEVG